MHVGMTGGEKKRNHASELPRGGGSKDTKTPRENQSHFSEKKKREESDIWYEGGLQKKQTYALA